MNVLHVFQNIDAVQSIQAGMDAGAPDTEQLQWSSDSLYILCAMFKRGVVQVMAPSRCVHAICRVMGMTLMRRW